MSEKELGLGEELGLELDQEQKPAGTKNKVEAAFEVAKDKYGSFAIVCGILDVSNSYMYRSIKLQELSLPCAHKMELILDGTYTWRDLAPEAAKAIDSVKDRI